MKLNIVSELSAEVEALVKRFIDEAKALGHEVEIVSPVVTAPAPGPQPDSAGGPGGDGHP